MSINAIGSVSLYEYYYTINKKEDTSKTDSVIDDKEAKKAQEKIETDNKDDKTQTISPKDRPWADLIYQLGLSFNDDPKQDIVDIKTELNNLVLGLDDKELQSEVQDLISYVDKMYHNFESSFTSNSDSLSTQLSMMSLINQIRF